MKKVHRFFCNIRAENPVISRGLVFGTGVALIKRTGD
jgi:hypothetical protein